MKLLSHSARFAVAAMLSAASIAFAAAPAETTGSVYALTAPLTDQAGQAFTLADKRGTPMVVSMFYTSCQFVCPMLVDAIRANEQMLSEAERKKLNVLLVTFDPAHDSVEVLRQTASQRQLDATRWQLARTNSKDVRKLAAMLDIQYRAIGNGDFNHSTALVLVDAQGRIVGRTTDLSGADPAFVKLMKTTLASTNR
jgi:protein SCO1